MPKSLAQAHIKVAILTTQPANAAAPTVAELNGGINAAARIVADDWTFGAQASDKVQEKSLADANNINALGASNYQLAFTLFRYFNAGTGAAEPTEDTLFTAVKTKGTRIWVYARETGLLESAAWASSQEIFLGMEALTDSPQEMPATGYIKKRVECEPQAAYPNIAAA